jgi:hypothetical protein
MLLVKIRVKAKSKTLREGGEKVKKRGGKEKNILTI